MIPKIIHYVWVGPRPVPAADQRYIDGWKTLLPDFEFRFWNMDTIDFKPRYLRQAVAAKAWNRVSDYQRVCALQQYGGVYLDTDIELLKPLQPLLDAACFVGAQDLSEEMDLVNGAVIGATPGHWLMNEMRQFFDTKLDGRWDTASFSGPGLLSQILLEHGLTRHAEGAQTVRDVVVHPPSAFYPYKWNEEFDPACIRPDTVAVHHWAKTWGPPSRKSLREKLIRKVLHSAPDVTHRLILRNLRRLEKQRQAAQN